jgi:DUF917 family protein
VISWGRLQTTGAAIRAQANYMKSLIAMARDPVPVSYTLEHGAPGAIKMGINLGHHYFEAGNDPYLRVKSATDFLGGEIVCQAVIVDKIQEATDGFDVGLIRLAEENDEWELSYMNEYMTLEKNGERLATFPDLLTTFNEKGEPVTSAALEKEQIVYLIYVPKEKIPVGDGNKYAEAYEPIERSLNKPMVDYLKDYLKG